MLKEKYIKLVTVSFLVLIALWVATPKVYINALLNHNHPNVALTAEAKVKSQPSTEDYDMEKYNKPTYFNLFKFIFSFIPSKGKATE